MTSYTEFMVEAQHGGTSYKVLVKSWFNTWHSGYVKTNYFSINYNTKEAALEAIEKYKVRCTHVR